MLSSPSAPDPSDLSASVISLKLTDPSPVRLLALLVILTLVASCREGEKAPRSSSMSEPKGDSEASTTEFSPSEFEKIIGGASIRHRYPPAADPIPWERLVGAPEKYDGKLISLSGFFDFTKDPRRRGVYLFKSDDYRQVSQLQGGVALDVWNESGIAQFRDMNDLAALNGSYVRVVSIFRTSPDFLAGGEIGRMAGPFLIEFCKDGEYYSILSESAKWPE